MAVPYPLRCTVVYTVIAAWYQHRGWRLVRRRPGVNPRFSESAVLTLAVVRDLDGDTPERRWERRVAATWRGVFPQAPERRVRHKRTKRWGWRLAACRCRLLDGTPVPVGDVSRVGRPDGSRAGQHWIAHGAEIGRCAAPGWWVFGFKLGLTASGDLVPDHAVLIPAAADDREAALARLQPGMIRSADRTCSRFAFLAWRDTRDQAGVTVLAPPPRRHAASQDPHTRLRRRRVCTRPRRRRAGRAAPAPDVYGQVVVVFVSPAHQHLKGR